MEKDNKFCKEESGQCDKDGECHMEKKIEPYTGLAKIYDEIRPSYPDRLIQDVIEKANLKIEDELLEIGAGTGKATVQFVERGFKIHAIELGEDMAEILKDKCVNYSNVSLDVAPFEEWSYPFNKKYDGIYCAQAFHWLDTNIKYKKCHELLKDNSYLILFWYAPCEDNTIETQELNEKVDKIIERYVDNYSLVEGKPERRAHLGTVKEDEREIEIRDSGLFELVEKIEYTQQTKNNAKQYMKVRKSVPAFASIFDKLSDETIEKMDKEIEEVINTHGGYVGATFKFSLYITKRIS